MGRQRAYSVNVLRTKIARISRTVVQTWKFDRVTGTITYGLLYFLEKLKNLGRIKEGCLFHYAYI